MKANYMAAAACILALAACSKAELGEGVSAPRGETVTLTVPQTKAGLDGNILKFEGDETIYAVASNGSTATLTAQDNSGTFTGTFSAPVTDGSTISLYCHNVEGTETFAQNGKPWLQSLGNSFTRTEGREISLTATLTAPAGVRAVAFITDGTGIESLEFHTKSGAKFTTFDGSAFGGEAVSAQQVVTNSTGYTNSTIFNVPDGLEGGYWIKAVKGGQSMYKSYSSSTAVTKDSKIEVKEFVPASVKLDVQLSGFPTSYSYYVANEEGSGVTSKDVAKANATANDWIGAGKATYTITREGIPSTLLKFESFKLTVDGKELTGTEAEKPITYDASNGHTTWGQKDIVATVTYTNLATGAPVTASKTVTRHITGLPYSTTNIDLSGTKESETISFKVPSNTGVELKLNDITASSLSRLQKGHLYVKIGNTDLGKQIEAGNTKFDNVHSDEIKLQGVLLNSNGDIFLTRNTSLPGPYVKISSVSVKFN